VPEEEEEDPLDAFMQGVVSEVKELKKKGVNVMAIVVLSFASNELNSITSSLFYKPLQQLRVLGF
jgi:hypothetical protein